MWRWRPAAGPSRYPNPTICRTAVSAGSLGLLRLDLLKLDVEGMAFEALVGARETIGRCRPVIQVETVKAPKDLLSRLLAGQGYATARHGLNLLCVHR